MWNADPVRLFSRAMNVDELVRARRRRTTRCLKPFIVVCIDYNKYRRMLRCKGTGQALWRPLLQLALDLVLCSCCATGSGAGGGGVVVARVGGVTGASEAIAGGDVWSAVLVSTLVRWVGRSMLTSSHAGAACQA
jgi:hypothetical protein